MKDEPRRNQTLEFEKKLNGNKQVHYTLKLYVTGTTPQSSRAIDNLNKICEKHLKGRYTLDVIDLYKNPKLAAEEQIIAVPTLFKKLPLPLRRIIGDMSDTDRVLIGLDLKKTNYEFDSSK